MILVVCTIGDNPETYLLRPHGTEKLDYMMILQVIRKVLKDTQ